MYACVCVCVCVGGVLGLPRGRRGDCGARPGSCGECEGLLDRRGFSLLLGRGGGLRSPGTRRGSWKSPGETRTRRGSKRSSRGSGTKKETSSRRERPRRRDGEGSRGRRQGEAGMSGARDKARERASRSRGRESRGDAGVAETMRATDTPDRERGPETSTGDHRSGR